MYSAVNTFEWCVLHVRHKLQEKKKVWQGGTMPLNFFAYLSFPLLLLFKLDWNSSRRGAQYCGMQLSAPQSHTPSTPSQSNKAFTSLSPLHLSVDHYRWWCKAMWQRLKKTCSTDSQHCDLLFIVGKTKIWPQCPWVTQIKQQLDLDGLLMGNSEITPVCLCLKKKKKLSLSWQSDLLPIIHQWSPVMIHLSILRVQSFEGSTAEYVGDLSEFR